MHSSVREKISVRGFTLIELMLVLLIIALLTAIVYPSFGGLFEGVSARAQKYAIVSAFRQARWEAISGGQTYRAVFTRAKEHWDLHFEVAANAPGEFKIVAEQWAKFESQDLPKTIVISQTPTPLQSARAKDINVIEFTPQGTACQTLIGFGLDDPKFILISNPQGIVSLFEINDTTKLDDQKLFLREYFQKIYGNDF